MSDSMIAAQLAMIREKRTIEATRDDLMGERGKLGLIAKYLGDPIIVHMSDIDSYDEYLDELPTMSTQSSSYTINSNDSLAKDEDFVEGYLFDGLRRGMHLEIQTKKITSEIKVLFKGYMVYHEIQGDLACFVPKPEWRDLIDKLYLDAKERRGEHKNVARQIKELDIVRKTQEFVDYLKSRWGWGD